MKAKRPPIAPMHPREQLTKKAKQAIWAYIHHMADVKMQGYPMAWFMFEWTLQAERMPRERLYKFLEEKGYRWDGGGWRKPAQ